MQSLAILHDRSLRNSILGIAIPIALQNLITYMTGMMDTVMLGQLGEVELSGASLANQFGTVYMVLTFGIASGTNVLLSQYWGKGDTRSIRSILSIMYRVTLALSLLFTAAARFFPELILSLFSSDPLVIAAGSRYLALVCFSYTLNGMTNVMLMSLRSVGTVGISILVYSSSFFANTALNWVLIFCKLGFPALGMEGAAIATIIARALELTIASVYLFGFEKKIGYTLRDVAVYDRSFAKDFAINVTPVMLNELIWSLGNSTVIAIMGRMGRDLVSANAIANITAQFTQIFIIGIANAASVVIGNGIGMGEQERTKSLAKALVIVAGGFGLVAAGLMLLLRGPVIGLYNIPEATKILTRQIMAVFSLITVFRSVEFVGLIGVLRGGGDNRFVLFCDVFFLWAVAIPLGAVTGLWLKLPAPLVCFVLQCDVLIKLLVTLPRIWGGRWVRDVTRPDLPESSGGLQ